LARGLDHAHHRQDNSGDPKSNLEDVKDEESLEAGIAVQGGDVLGRQLVRYDYERFSGLCVSEEAAGLGHSVAERSGQERSPRSEPTDLSWRRLGPSRRTFCTVRYRGLHWLGQLVRNGSH